MKKKICCQQYVDVENVLVPDKISLGEINYKYFIGYLHNDNKGRSLHKVLSKTSAYVKSYDEQTKLTYFWLEDDDLFIIKIQHYLK